MALDIIQAGKDWLLWVMPSGGSQYIPVACLKENDFTPSTKMADTSSKCGAGYETSIPVMQGWKMTGSGFAIDANSGNPAKASFDYLFSRWQSQIQDGNPIQIKWGKATPTTGEVIYSGSAYIDSLDLKAPNQDSVNFTVTFTGVGAPVVQVT